METEDLGQDSPHQDQDALDRHREREHPQEQRRPHPPSSRLQGQVARLSRLLQRIAAARAPSPPVVAAAVAPSTIP